MTPARSDPGLSTERLKTEFRVQARLRQCAASGLMAAVAKKGDPDAGALFLKVNRFAAGCEVFSGVTQADEGGAWLRATGRSPVSEQQADRYIARQITYDPDLWVLEIEDPKAQFVLEGKILDI